jgi:hypothetical protein
MAHIMGAAIKTRRMTLTTRNVVVVEELFLFYKNILYYSDFPPTGLVFSLVFKVTVHSRSSPK